MGSFCRENDKVIELDFCVYSLHRLSPTVVVMVNLF